MGDKCICPKKGHKNCTIVEGDPDFTVDGVPVAFDGHKTSCGATLIASLSNFNKG
ncbi:PAAR motif family protein [Caldimonas brevitalea]|uniref:PAAR motif family protein n=1 Tax=Caldimonas brevitalea TaxID=413882 RepID=A0A0G3BGP9_9BURK|nr:PAAR motif family protein [Caldimonas brevitalea]